MGNGELAGCINFAGSYYPLLSCLLRILRFLLFAITRPVVFHVVIWNVMSIDNCQDFGCFKVDYYRFDCLPSRWVAGINVSLDRVLA